MPRLRDCGPLGFPEAGIFFPRGRLVFQGAIFGLPGPLRSK